MSTPVYFDEAQICCCDRVAADIAVADFVKPDQPHPRVNKCLIALVAKKLVTKRSENVSCAEHGCN